MDKLTPELLGNSLQQVFSTLLVLVLLLATFELALYVAWKLAEWLDRPLRRLPKAIAYGIQVGVFGVLCLGTLAAALSVLGAIDFKELIQPIESDIVRGGILWAGLSVIGFLPLVAFLGLFVSLLRLQRQPSLRLAFMLLAPAGIGLGVLIVYPMYYELRLAFSNMSLRNFKEFEIGF